MAKKKTTRNTASRQQKSLRELAYELHATLDDAYWAATTVDAKDRISGVMRVVLDLARELTRLELEGRTADFEAMQEEIEDALGHIEDLRDEIDDLIQHVKVATEVAKYAEKIITAAAGVMV